jgi:hypothetical protein
VAWTKEERSWPSNFEMGWGIWLGHEKNWFWGEQKTRVITKQAGCGVNRVLLEVVSDQ